MALKLREDLGGADEVFLCISLPVFAKDFRLFQNKFRGARLLVRRVAVFA